MAKNPCTCDPGVRQDSSIMWPRKRERGVRAPTLISIIVEYRMEFTRGPKCSPKYFIIEIVPRWAIKLERTSLSGGKKGGPLERCVPSALGFVYTHVHVALPGPRRPRNHRGNAEILTEHGFMTVSSAYTRERKTEAQRSRMIRERQGTRKGSKRGFGGEVMNGRGTKQARKGEGRAKYANVLV